MKKHTLPAVIAASLIASVSLIAPVYAANDTPSAVTDSSFSDSSEDQEDGDTVEEDSYFTSPDRIEWNLGDAGNVLMDASATAGGNVGIVINYVMPLENGFDLEFNFILKDGSSRGFASSYTDSINGDTLFIRVREVLERAGVSADDVSDFFIMNNGSGTIYSVDIGTGSSSDVRVSLTNKEENPAQTNPATGAVIPVFTAAIAGAAAFVFRKRR